MLVELGASDSHVARDSLLCVQALPAGIFGC